MAAPTNQPVGDGVTFQYNLTSGSATDSGWTTLLVVEKVNGNPIKAPIVKTTKISDTSETKQPGVPDFGSLKLEGRFNGSMSSTIMGWMLAKTMFYGKIAVVDNGTSAGSSQISTCFVEEFDPFGSLEPNKEILSNITIGINGSASFTAHA